MEEVIRQQRYYWSCAYGLILSVSLHTHDLLFAKLHAHNLSMDAIKFNYSYLKRRKQGLKIMMPRVCLKYFYQEYLKDPSQVRSYSTYLLTIQLPRVQLSAWLLVCSYLFWLCYYVIFQVPTYQPQKYSTLPFLFPPIIQTLVSSLIFWQTPN